MESGSSARGTRLANATPSLAEDEDDLRLEVERRQWYHTFELTPEITTPGFFDLRSVVDLIPFPASLRGKRCLDVGTFDGFWAFEMERRGGDVVAIDVLDPLQWDWPAGAEDATVEALAARKREGSGFELVAGVLGSEVDRRELSVYDLDPAEIGTFDYVYFGSLLLHLRDPVLALTKMREVCSGQLVLCDAIDAKLSLLFREPMATLDGVGRPWWWRPNVAGLERMVESAGFTRVGKTRRLRLSAGKGMVIPPISVAGLRSKRGREQLVHSRFGDPHAVILAT